MKSNQFDDWDVVVSQRMSGRVRARSYAEKLADGATKKSYRKSHMYGDRPSNRHDIVRGKRGK